MKRLQFLKAFLMQVAWLKDVDARMRLPPAFARHLISTEVLRREESQDNVIELLARYRNEWMTIASDKQKNGYNWARLLAVREPEMEGVTHASAWRSIGASAQPAVPADRCAPRSGVF